MDMLWLFGTESNVEPGNTLNLVCPRCTLLRPCVEVVKKTGFSVWMVTLSENKKLDGYVCQHCGRHFETEGEVNIDLLTKLLNLLVQEGNNAKQIAANEMNSAEIRLTQLTIARDKLEELEQMARLYSGITITSLDEFKSELAEIETQLVS
jgi:hypothetical protein